MPKTLTGEHFVDIVKPLHEKLHSGIQYQNEFQAEGAIGNGTSPASEETGAGKSESGGGVERAGFEDQGHNGGGHGGGESSKTSEPGNY